MTYDKAAFGIFASRSGAEEAVWQLKDAGYSPSDISVLFSSPDSSAEFAHQNSTKAPEGATTGVVAGATAGGLMGWLVGVGSLAIPGAGPFIAAGPIMAALAGLGVGGAVGGVTGALIGLGIPEYEAGRYEQRLGEGGVLLSVVVADSDDAEKAKGILDGAGAEDISVKSVQADEPRAAEPLDQR